MERLCDLLFELSNEDRLNILNLLMEESLILSHISKKLESSVQETSRNVSRLSENGLIVRDADGLYKITSVGKYALHLLSGYEFLSKHSEYIQSHDLDRLPLEFLTRVGDLSCCSYTGDAMVTFFELEKLIQGADDYLVYISEQHLVSAVPPLIDALNRGVKIRAMICSNQGYPEGYFDQPAIREAWPVFGKANREGLFEERYLPAVDISLGVSENTGVIFIPRVDGVFDYNGLKLEDERSHKFAQDLFEYYWGIASTESPQFVKDSKYYSRAAG